MLKCISILRLYNWTISAKFVISRKFSFFMSICFWLQGIKYFISLSFWMLNDSHQPLYRLWILQVAIFITCHICVLFCFKIISFPFPFIISIITYFKKNKWIYVFPRQHSCILSRNYKWWWVIMLKHMCDNGGYVETHNTVLQA